MRFGELDTISMVREAANTVCLIFKEFDTESKPTDIIKRLIADSKQSTADSEQPFVS
jgi:hypothetical protein